MKRLVIAAALALTLLLLLPTIALAGSYSQVVQVPGGLPIDDIHVRAYYWTAGPTRNDLPITGGSVIHTNGSSAGAVTISGNTTLTCTAGSPWAPGTYLKVKLQSSASPSPVYMWYEWTSGGVVVSQPMGDYEDIEYPGGATNSVITADAWVQRSIKLTLGAEDVHFGRVRYSEGVYTESTSLHAESNDEYSLYVSGHPDLAASRGDMTEFLGVRLEDTASGWAYDTGMGGLAADHTCTIVGEDLDGGLALPPPPDPDWWVESFFDVYFDLDPEPGDRPGYYRSDVDFFAIQTF